MLVAMIAVVTLPKISDHAHNTSFLMHATQTFKVRISTEDSIQYLTSLVSMTVVSFAVSFLTVRTLLPHLT